MSQHLVLDNLQFARRAAEIEGSLELSEMSRLAASVIGGGPVNYRLSGGSGSQGEPLLRLQLLGDLVLQCQRCLQPLVHRLEVAAIFELREAIGDDALVQEDLEDDSRDYLTTDRSMDLLLLIEDEAMLALPVAPRHEKCDPPMLQQDPEAASPFGVLLSLKGQSGKTH